MKPTISHVVPMCFILLWSALALGKGQPAQDAPKTAADVKQFTPRHVNRENMRRQWAGWHWEYFKYIGDKMRMTGFKWFLIFISMLATPLATNTWAEDITAQFMKTCIQNKNSRSFCECALKGYSENRRKQKKEELQKTIERTEKMRASMLSDPAMTEEKFDAVLKLHELALEQDKLATQAWGTTKYRERRAKKTDLYRQKFELIKSYKKVNGPIKRQLLHGTFCDSWCNLNRYKKELAEIDKTSFAGSIKKGKILTPHNYLYKNIIAYGLKANCHR